MSAIGPPMQRFERLPVGVDRHPDAVGRLLRERRVEADPAAPGAASHSRRPSARASPVDRARDEGDDVLVAQSAGPGSFILVTVPSSSTRLTLTRISPAIVTGLERRRGPSRPRQHRRQTPPTAGTTAIVSTPSVASARDDVDALAAGLGGRRRRSDHLAPRIGGMRSVRSMLGFGVTVTIKAVLRRTPGDGRTARPQPAMVHDAARIERGPDVRVSRRKVGDRRQRQVASCGKITIFPANRPSTSASQALLGRLHAAHRAERAPRLELPRKRLLHDERLVGDPRSGRSRVLAPLEDTPGDMSSATRVPTGTPANRTSIPSGAIADEADCDRGRAMGR